MSDHVAKATSIVECDAFLDRFMAAGNASEETDDPAFFHAFGSCQAEGASIFHRDLGTNADGRTVFAIAEEGAALSTMLDEMLAPPEDDDICEQTIPGLPDRAALDDLTKRIGTYRVRVGDFGDCRQWYEKVSQCVFNIDPAVTPEEGETPDPTPLSSYKEWIDEWEKNDRDLSGKLDRLGPMLKRLEARKVAVQC